MRYWEARDRPPPASAPDALKRLPAHPPGLLARQQTEKDRHESGPVFLETNGRRIDRLPPRF